MMMKNYIKKLLKTFLIMHSEAMPHLEKEEWNDEEKKFFKDINKFSNLYVKGDVTFDDLEEWHFELNDDEMKIINGLRNYINKMGFHEVELY